MNVSNYDQTFNNTGIKSFIETLKHRHASNYKQGFKSNHNGDGSDGKTHLKLINSFDQNFLNDEDDKPFENRNV